MPSRSHAAALTLHFPARSVTAAGVAADDGKVDAPRSRAPVDVTLKLTDVDADTCDLFAGGINIRDAASSAGSCAGGASGQQGGQEQTGKENVFA